jgi:hypothetical protein
VQAKNDQFIAGGSLFPPLFLSSTAKKKNMMVFIFIDILNK